MTELELLQIARAIHMAKVRDCSFPNHNGPTGYVATLARQPWPEDRKQAMRMYQAGQVWMDIAMAQARAAVKAIEAINEAKS